MSAYTFKVKALYVVGSANGIIERLYKELFLLAAKHGGNVIEPDPAAITFYLHWCVNLVGDKFVFEKEKEIFVPRYPGVWFALEETEAPLNPPC